LEENKSPFYKARNTVPATESAWGHGDPGRTDLISRGEGGEKSRTLLNGGERGGKISRPISKFVGGGSGAQNWKP